MTDYTSPDGARSALLTIDVQTDFTLPGAPACIPDTLEAVPAMRDVVEAFRRGGRPVVHVVRLYLPDGSNAELCRRQVIQEGARIVAPGSDGAELVDELRPSRDVRLDAPLLLEGRLQRIAEREWLLYKPRWGAFYATPLERHLRSLGVDTVVICGCNFPNCPRTTLYEASERDFKVVLVTDATSGVYERGLREAESIGAVLQTAGECSAWLRGAVPSSAGVA